ncbi:MAG: hypothetical protein JOZ73_12525, partial [Solirubrobacterales bacterium]|nr:hypothetical protein [Solirubrobacterales bacterium]
MIGELTASKDLTPGARGAAAREEQIDIMASEEPKPIEREPAHVEIASKHRGRTGRP